MGGIDLPMLNYCGEKLNVDSVNPWAGCIEPYFENPNPVGPRFQ